MQGLVPWLSAQLKLLLLFVLKYNLAFQNDNEMDLPNVNASNKENWKDWMGFEEGSDLCLHFLLCFEKKLKWSFSIVDDNVL